MVGRCGPGLCCGEELLVGDAPEDLIGHALHVAFQLGVGGRHHGLQHGLPELVDHV